jgi:hypothetical protein
VTWVKVRGHSDNRGNDQAGAAATRGMNGQTEHVLEVAQYVNDLMGRMAWRTDPADAAHNPNILDAVSAAKTHATNGGPPA